MTYLICMLGADESYAGAAAKLEAMLGLQVSSTAVQRTTEKTGERIPDAPDELIDEQRQQQPYSLMVVELGGTTSPQITEQEGVTGLASLRAPTCYKECNLVVIEKHCDGKVVDRWTGGRYGPRQEFAGYAEQAGLRMGFLDAPRTLFLGDGARHNWALQQTHFPAIGDLCCLSFSLLIAKHQIARYTANTMPGSIQCRSGPQLFSVARSIYPATLSRSRHVTFPPRLEYAIPRLR